MPIEVSCRSCAGQFRVPDTAAGKKIRCPKCKGAIDVPAASAPPPAAPEFVPPPPPAVAKSAPPRAKAAAKPSKPQPKVEQWVLKTEEGEDYGPVPREELDAWYEEGRVTADCQVLMRSEEH